MANAMHFEASSRPLFGATVLSKTDRNDVLCMQMLHGCFGINFFTLDIVLYVAPEAELLRAERTVVFAYLPCCCDF